MRYLYYKFEEVGQYKILTTSIDGNFPGFSINEISEKQIIMRDREKAKNNARKIDPSIFYYDKGKLSSFDEKLVYLTEIEIKKLKEKITKQAKCEPLKKLLDACSSHHKRGMRRHYRYYNRTCGKPTKAIKSTIAQPIKIERKTEEF